MEGEGYLCEAFAFWTFHEWDILIRLVVVGLGIRGVTGSIGEELVSGNVWRGKGD